MHLLKLWPFQDITSSPKCYNFIYSPGTEDSFTFDTRPSQFTKTVVARIPEEDDVMETGTGSGAENSSESVSESENETGKQSFFLLSRFYHPHSSESVSESENETGKQSFFLLSRFYHPHTQNLSYARTTERPEPGKPGSFLLNSTCSNSYSHNINFIIKVWLTLILPHLRPSVFNWSSPYVSISQLSKLLISDCFKIQNYCGKRTRPTF